MMDVLFHDVRRLHDRLEPVLEESRHRHPVRQADDAAEGRADGEDHERERHLPR